MLFFAPECKFHAPGVAFRCCQEFFFRDQEIHPPAVCQLPLKGRFLRKKIDLKLYRFVGVRTVVIRKPCNVVFFLVQKANSNDHNVTLTFRTIPETSLSPQFQKITPAEEHPCPPTKNFN